ncbi:ComEC/Rec2 family competence protein [Fulvimarina pelagi]|uniref:ComEC/Rec2 family competence protein n=1 Tax=Fulvimarina pelagi TaxID=217511 RepID=UPI0002ED8A6F|nr:ComEC/Rec2 family competence protein [Fulvimarina pelagi]
MSEPADQDLAGTGGTRFTPVPEALLDRLASLARLAASSRLPQFGEWLAAEWENERAHRTTFHLIPVSMAAGAVAVFGLGAGLTVMAVLGVFLALAVLSIRFTKSATSPTLILVLASLLAGLCFSHFELRRTGTTIFSGQATVFIKGRVAGHELDDRQRSRYLVDINSTERPVLSRPPERVRIVVAGEHDVMRPGDRFEGLVRLRPPAGPAFPGSYDFAFVPYFEGLGAYGFSLGIPKPRSELSTEGPPPTLSEQVAIAVADLRGMVTDRIRAIIPGQPGAVAAALVTGQRNGIDEETSEALRATGLAHILAISGLHVALVAGFAMVSIRRSLVLVGHLALVWPIKKIAAVGAIGVSTFYLVLSGSSVATERAYLMLLVMLLAVLFDRPAITMRNVSIAAIAILALSPHAVMTASFQMSFAATIGLVGVYGAFSRYRGGRSRDISEGALRTVFFFLVGTAATALIAGLATTPYSIFHFQRFAPFGLVANLLVMPLFSLLIMPMALLGVVLMPVGLDAIPLTAVGMGLDALIAIAFDLASQLPDQSTGLVRPSALITLSAALLIFCIPVGRLRWLAVPFLATGLVMAIDRAATPEFLIFEDGKTFALIENGTIAYSKGRPNSFVSDQWDRAYRAEGTERGLIPGLKDCESKICRFTTPSGITVAYTTDYRLLGEACDSAEIAFVARAARTRRCRSGAHLVTLRTLRRSGSLAIARDPSSGEIVVSRSVLAAPADWNRHRHAPWPEYWRKPEADDGTSPKKPSSTMPPGKTSSENSPSNDPEKPGHAPSSFASTE